MKVMIIIIAYRNGKCYMVHSEAMFFEIMCLYAIFTDYVELELDLL